MAISFFDQNLARAYPFIANDRSQIGDALAVDFRGTILQGQFDPAVHRLYLAWIARFGDRLRLGIRTDCPDLADHELVFEVGPETTKFTTLFARATPALDTLEERCGCGPNLVCDPGFGAVSGDCSVNLICDPNFAASCGPEQVCNPKFQAG